MQKAGPELLLPVPPRASGDVKDSRSSAIGHPNAVPPGHEGSDHQDVHLVEDKQKLQVRIRARLVSTSRSTDSLERLISNQFSCRPENLSLSLSLSLSLFVFFLRYRRVLSGKHYRLDRKRAIDTLRLREIVLRLFTYSYCNVRG